MTPFEREHSHKQTPGLCRESRHKRPRSVAKWSRKVGWWGSSSLGGKTTEVQSRYSLSLFHVTPPPHSVIRQYIRKWPLVAGTSRARSEPRPSLNNRQQDGACTIWRRPAQTRKRVSAGLRRYRRAVELWENLVRRNTPFF